MLELVTGDMEVTARSEVRIRGSGWIPWLQARGVRRSPLAGVHGHGRRLRAGGLRWRLSKNNYRRRPDPANLLPFYRGEPWESGEMQGTPHPNLRGRWSAGKRTTAGGLEAVYLARIRQLLGLGSGIGVWRRLVVGDRGGRKKKVWHRGRAWGRPADNGVAPARRTREAAMVGGGWRGLVSRWLGGRPHGRRPDPRKVVGGWSAAGKEVVVAGVAGEGRKGRGRAASEKVGREVGWRGEGGRARR